MSALAWIGAITGLLGGITGLLGFGFQVWFYLATGPRVKLSVLWALQLNNEQECLDIEVINSGRMTAIIQSISIVYSTTDHSPLAFFPMGAVTGPSFPHPIESHSAANWLVTQSSLKSAISSINATQSFKVKLTLATSKVIETDWVDLPAARI